MAARLVEAAGDGALVARLRSDEFAVAPLRRRRRGVACGRRTACVCSSPVRSTSTGAGCGSPPASAWSLAGRATRPTSCCAGPTRRRRPGQAGRRQPHRVWGVDAARPRAAPAIVERSCAGRSNNDGLAVHYQPIVDARDRSVVGAEALLRVHDEEGALLSPARVHRGGRVVRAHRPARRRRCCTLTCEQLAAWAAQLRDSGRRSTSRSTSRPGSSPTPASPAQVVDALNAAGRRARAPVPRDHREHPDRPHQTRSTRRSPTCATLGRAHRARRVRRRLVVARLPASASRSTS